MAVNPLGAQQVHDFGVPFIITGRAREIISGGHLVMASGAESVVSSGLVSFAGGSDLQFSAAASGAKFNGVALNNVASGGLLQVAKAGVFILPCDGSVLAGEPVECLGREAVQTIGSLAIPAAAFDAGMASRRIGRALTAGASGGFAVIDITA